MFTSYDVRESWDGTYDGKPCDQGIYFFVLSYAGNIVPQSDYIKGEIPPAQVSLLHACS
ncbi:MAG: gliding motility-associated C-terminal domain-containing protein [Taibaiella sp.]|nr:gliding motility-associated C-terminal domain-containing protein [Taibaiella sp.]